MSRLVLALVALAGCFDSLVENPCATGYELARGRCVARSEPDAGMPDAPTPDASTPDASTPDASTPDAGSPDASTPDASTPDALVCTSPLVECDGACVDVATDPQHCGTCGRTCPSGICEAGHCLGELSGHIVAIGHDYRAHHPAMRRLLANGLALGPRADLGIARLRGSATDAAHGGTTTAISLGLAALGRAWHPVAIPQVPDATTLADVDVLVVEAQTGDAATAQTRGLAWATAIDQLLQRGGVVVVLEGAGGASHHFAQAAGLFTAAGLVETTGLPAVIIDASDAVVQQVLSPYLAETTSTVFAGLAGPVVTMHGTLVVHETRY